MQVHHEDCDFSGIVTQPFGTPRGATPRGATFAGRPSGEVFVQHARNSGDFKHVTPEKARQVYGVGDGPHPRRAHGNENVVDKSKTSDIEARLEESGWTKHGEHRWRKKFEQADELRRGPPARSWTTAGITAASLDTDAAALAVSDENELGVFELLVQGERWHLLLATTTCVCQNLLAGLSLVVGSIASSAYVGGERLEEALGVIEPLLTGLCLTLAEAALIGCLLRALHARDRAGVEATTSDEGAAKRGAEQDCPGQAAVRHQSILQVTLGIISALANAAVVILCLLGQRNDMLRASGFVPWAMPDGSDDSDVWDPSRAFLLLGLRAAFGLFALGPTVLDLQFLVVPALSPSGLTYASGIVSGSPH